MSNKKYLGIIGNKNLIRDADSRGILNIDTDALNKYKSEREEKQKLIRIIAEHEQLKSDINEIKHLLKELLGKE